MYHRPGDIDPNLNPAGGLSSGQSFSRLSSFIEFDVFSGQANRLMLVESDIMTSVLLVLKVYEVK